ncbi:lymphocyte antigen 6 complex locus protein G6d-like [Archocentrus centrarchus]|uniref:lymphocyte antigen 6 complex locus protein G6d-like n=1 Tax=Archocentrus centrarchus TaxID=63155 RepID=UPI0011E9E633|nr:lymphocyte antigen 6 complex locus protein G6d-like [Archocentrus centrarchus]
MTPSGHLRSLDGGLGAENIPLRMKGLIFCVFAIVMLTPAQGDEEEQLKQLMESVAFEVEEEYLECFRCDLGFWDVCYTTEINCSLGERCYTGRGKAANSLDVKTLGCAKAEECNVEMKVDLFSNETLFVMTKHCCDTPFCNSASKLSIYTLMYVTVALTTWLTEDSAYS